MSFEIDLRARVLAATDADVYWNERPQATAYPAVVIETIFGGRDQTFSGLTGAQRVRVQFSCFATSKAAAVTLRNALMVMIETPATQGSTVFQGGFVNFHRDSASNTNTVTIFTEIIDADLWRS